MVRMNVALDNYEKQYENCISLGWFCGTAASLAKLGVRNCSGSFDWYYSPYWAVLNQIENNFQDFMVKDNLKVDVANSMIFDDTKYGFRFNHDIKENFEVEYDSIREKYVHRVELFCKMVTRPTIFFRCIRDMDEVDYINQNWNYAESLLQNFNKKNHIVYVMHRGLRSLTDKVDAYYLGIDTYSGDTLYTLRHMFDSSDILIELCARLVSVEKMRHNIDFDNRHNAQRVMSEYINKCVREDKNGIDELILLYLNASKETEIFIWGCGVYGKALAQYLLGRGVKIKGIIDNNPLNELMEGIKIIPFEKVPDGSKIFTAVSNKENNNAIVKQISDSPKNIKFIRYQDIFEDSRYLMK